MNLYDSCADGVKYFRDGFVQCSPSIIIPCDPIVESLFLSLIPNMHYSIYKLTMIKISIFGTKYFHIITLSSLSQEENALYTTELEEFKLDRPFKSLNRNNVNDHLSDIKNFLISRLLLVSKWICLL